MKINEICHKPVIVAAPTDSLATLAKLMHEHNVGAVVVLQEERPVGILTDRDLALAVGAQGASLQTPVAKIMTRKVLAIPEDTDVFSASRYILECGVRRLPVVDRTDRVVGMVSLDDLLRLLGRELFNLAEGIKREMVVK